MDVRYNPFHSYIVLMILLVSGLLVTGPEGSGKTSVVNTVAKLLEEDVNTLTCKWHPHRQNHTHHLPDIHYVDVSAIAGQSVSSVKAQFHYWFEKCAWHAPSILVLDNLDKLLSAEVEVRIFYRGFGCILNRYSACRFISFAPSHRIVPSEFFFMFSDGFSQFSWHSPNCDCPFDYVTTHFN